MFSHDLTQVLLIKKNRPAWQAGRLNGIGGKVEEGEAPLEAMQREFREEAGLEVNLADWELFCVRQGEWGSLYCYTACGDVHAAKSMEDEQVMLVPVPELNQLNTLPSVQWMIPMALDPARTFATVNDRA